MLLCNMGFQRFLRQDEPVAPQQIVLAISRLDGKRRLQACRIPIPCCYRRLSANIAMWCRPI